MKNRILSGFLSVVLLFCCLNITVFAEDKKGVVTGLSTSTTNLYVRTGPGTSYSRLSHGGSDVTFHNGDEVTVIDTVSCSDSSASEHPTWYKISFTKGTTALTGYVSAKYITIREQTGELTQDFEASISAFPEDYKVKLRELHLYHPEWKFIPVQTNLDWNDVIYEESLPKVNYIHTTDPYSWRSTAAGSYDWTTDVWVSRSSGTRYDASKEVVEYFMDPRNFLDEVRVFQFENLSYDSGVHTLAGVEKMLKGTFMEGKTISNGTTNVSYAQAYMDAAAASGVSPYHLAARTRQEVGTSGSSSTSGTVSGYEGIYNFYNIHATPGAINGLIWAKEEGDWGRPWNSQYKSIVNGGKWIGSGYIDIGQDTLYFQKFAVVGSKLYWHQYMQTLTAPYDEAATIYNAYSNMGILDSALSFRIPIYKNMPSTACVKPTKTGSPNNWLKTLSVEGYSLTPTFECDGSTAYSLIVENHVSTVKVNCTAVSSTATIEGGTSRTATLNVGTNTVNIKVTAANGDIKTYALTIVRKTADGGTVDPQPPVAQSGYKIDYTVNGTTLTGVAVGTGLDTAKGKLGLYGEATAEFYNSAGTKITSGKITTGTTVKITANGTTDTFTFVIRGDTNGDGAVDAIDLLMIRRYMLGTYELKGANLTAGDCNKDGKVDAIDLLMVRRNLLGTYTIVQ